MPNERGFSGPTIVKELFFFANSRRFIKSLESISILFPVPPLPGAKYTFFFVSSDSFQPIECSLPPEPMIKILSYRFNLSHELRIRHKYPNQPNRQFHFESLGNYH